jgi:heme oxygenase (mycobilin-producing)
VSRATRPNGSTWQSCQPIVPWARFSLINVAEWESVQLYEVALNREEYRKLAEQFREVARYYPGLYEVVRT